MNWCIGVHCTDRDFLTVLHVEINKHKSELLQISQCHTPARMCTSTQSEPRKTTAWKTKTDRKKKNNTMAVTDLATTVATQCQSLRRKTTLHVPRMWRVTGRVGEEFDSAESRFCVCENTSVKKCTYFPFSSSCKLLELFHVDCWLLSTQCLLSIFWLVLKHKICNH